MVEVQARKGIVSMGDWVRHADAIAPDGTVIPKCGTAACLAGWCLTDQWFIDRGFRAYSSSGGEHAFPRFDGNSGMGAVERFFEMNEVEVDELFHPHGYDNFPAREIPVEAVIAKLDDYLERAP